MQANQTPRMIRYPLIFALALVSIAGCRSAEPPPVDPMAPAVQWNQTDALQQIRIVAEGITHGPWVQRYYDAHRGRRPKVMVANMRNTTGQYLNTFELQLELERFLLRTGRLTVVSGHAIADTSRRAPAVSVSELQALARRYDAEYLIVTNLSARAAPGMAHLTNYQLNVELLRMQPDSLIWSDARPIRRSVAGDR